MDKLVRERKSLEPRLKRISETVEKFRPEEAEEIEVQIELDTLSEVWAAFCAVHKRIVDASENDEEYEDAVQRQSKIESFYILLKNRLLKMLKLVKDRANGAAGQSPPPDIIRQLADQQAEFLRVMTANMAPVPTASHVLARNSAIPLPTDLKLPQMNMPIFSGNYLEWQSFFDLFDSLVHQNPGLKDSQKLYYLKTNLSGEAASLISHLKITDANYGLALEKLKSRYDKPREIANQHIKRFLTQPPLASSSAHGLRSLHDISDEVIRALKAMDREDRDTWLLFILSEKVDADTKQLWCQKTAEMEEDDVNLQCFLKFIESRSFALESAQSVKSKASVPFKQPSKLQYRGATAFVATNPPLCNVCSKQNHHLYQCGKFLHMSHDERLAHVKRMKLCNNCLKTHPGEACKAGTCRKCNLSHHTLLHHHSSPAITQPTRSASVMAQANLGQSAQSLISALDSPTCIDASNVLLATVAIDVLDSNGHPRACRAVLDCASQVSFISETFCKQLGLKTQAADVSLEGISATPAHANKCAEIIISSRCTDYRTSVPCIVLETISKTLPCKPANIDDWPIPGSVHLADPLFHRPGKVEVLLGIELFFQLLEPGKINLSIDDSLPTLQNTKLGWVIAGRYHEPKYDNESYTSTCFLTSTDGDLSQQLRKFWELEEYSTTTNHLSEEEQLCEQHFAEHTVRAEHGKFIVKLPFLRDPSQLGDSKQIAERRLYHLERKLDRNPQLRSEYHAFIREYIDLGHMSLVETISPKISVYLPHHCVVKTTSTTTKCRVVFDASAKTTNGLSLNDTLMCGPVIQDSLINILLRFRFPPIVLVGDVKQMYRMIWSNKDDCALLKILWRWNKDESVKEYRLNTVTFGTKSASYLATKCVQQLLESYRQQYPVAVEKAEKGIYIDDVLTGASSEAEAKMLREQLTEMFAAGGFHLRKWVSNCSDVLDGVPEADLELKIPIEENGSSIKALGMHWQPCSDEFHFAYYPKEISQPTKRTILSQIAGLFDPLGLLAPIIVRAKLVMQRLWELRVDWDATPPGESINDWFVLVQKLSLLDSFQIPRRAIDMRSWSRLYLHGYCDASKSAMGACIYIRAIDDKENVSSHLLCAKSKLAPIGNNRTTIPRLELCSAVILARLISSVRAALSSTAFYEIKAFSDSKVALAWMSAGAAKWKTFIANRVAEIATHLPSINWYHVGTRDNPADLISRGAFPDQLQGNSLWWHGPPWTPSGTEKNFAMGLECDTNEQRQIEREQRVTTVACFAVYENSFLDKMLSRYYPNLQLLLRVTARLLRFNHREFRVSDRLTPDEIDFALVKYLQHVQQQHFSAELKQLQRGSGVLSSSSLKQLDPFLDGNSLIRVGGRLRQSNLSYDNKHQIVLPRHSRLTSLILLYEHQEHLHCGPQSLLAATRVRFWILKGSSAARKVCRDCVTCHRVQPARMEQQMGQLPADRLKPLPPFSITGVDYAGPVQIIGRRARGAVPTKGYIALFVCFGTRAVHLEAVSDLSASAFLAAFTRFISRYGVPNRMYSDNATNLRSAAKILRELYKQIDCTERSDEVNDFLSNRRVEWFFIPARSPHHGGLWEAGIKVTKTFLNKIGGNYNYTFEELSTLLAQVAACMNSRPISTISDDPRDPQPLTPAHFLILRPLGALPEVNHLEQQIGSLSRWKYVQRLAQEFRVRWQTEYVQSLQKLAKWQSSSPNIAKGDFVLLTDDNEKPQQWPLGRIVELFPGQDGLVRVVAVQTASGVFRRDIRKLRRFPLDMDEYVAGRNGSEIPTRNLVGGLCSRKNQEPPYLLRSKRI
ncbi:uncharacterized protein LOC131680524 [Topomyia yanbarensis]|uniref:uncharacterized protein LOC131680524 n=1 Tax=Topomyia yanbarensis TaxID=2498891 RepID=UPI00273AFB7A|nr:uncharacterized protein LOC131680524 [Topomyia yanbarensis]